MMEDKHKSMDLTAPHLREEQLIDYRDGRLHPPVRDYVQGHLLECDECLALFNDVQEFFDDRREQEAEIPAIVRTAEWNALSHRLALGADSNNLAAKQRLRFWQRPRAGYALAAVSLALLILIGAWAIRLSRHDRQNEAQIQQLIARSESDRQRTAQEMSNLQAENNHLQQQAQALAAKSTASPTPSDQASRAKPAGASQIVLNTPIFDIYPADAVERSQNGNQSDPITIPQSAPIVTLLLNGAGQKTYPDYVLELKNNRDEVIWHGEGLIRDRYGNFVITIAHSILNTGTYRLKLFGRGAGPPQPLAEYVVVVR